METIEYKGFTIKIEPDFDACDPIAEWDGNVKYALWHRRYKLQNDTDLNTDDYSGWDELKQALIKKYRALAILPVYMYDHGGQTIRTTPFGGMYGYFDSGQLGFAFINKECLNEWGFKSRRGYEKATGDTLEDAIRQNVSLYDSYIRGDVYGYIIEDENEEQIDSCGGWYGDEGLEDMIAECKAIIDHEIEKAA